MTETVHRQFILPHNLAGTRLDAALANSCPEYSRSCLTQWLKQGYILIDGEERVPKYKVKGGESICIDAILLPQENWQAQALDLTIIHEDDTILVINKPADCVVHPAAGNPDNTLVNALLHHAPCLAQLPRAGLIHRLDKDTTGLLVIAKTLSAHHVLVQQLQARHIERYYVALVYGQLRTGGNINKPIGRHPTQRIKMAVVTNGKPAITHYRIQQCFEHFTLLDVKLETGRTHQIRVHLASIKHPTVGDQLYAKNRVLPLSLNHGARAVFSNFKRQALHAKRLGLIHPSTGEYCEWYAAIPDDMQQLLNCIGSANQR